MGPAVAGPGQGGHVPCPDLLQGQSKTCGPSLGRLDISGNDADEVACISGASRLASELCSGSQVCPTDPRRPPGIGPAQQEAGRRGLSQARYHKNQHGWCFGAEALPRKVFLEGSSCLGSWSLGHMGTARGWTIMSLIRVKNPRTQAACVTPAQLCPFFQPSELAEPRDTGRRATCPDCWWAPLQGGPWCAAAGAGQRGGFRSMKPLSPLPVLDSLPHGQALGPCRQG